MARRLVNMVGLMALAGFGIGLTGCGPKEKIIYFDMPRGVSAEDEVTYKVTLQRPLLLSEITREGFLDIHQERWESGAEQLERALANGKNVYFCHLALGVCYEKMEDYQAAYDHYQEAHRMKLEDDPLNGWKRVEPRLGKGSARRGDGDRSRSRDVDPGELDLDD